MDNGQSSADIIHSSIKKGQSMEQEKNNPLKEKSYSLALQIVRETKKMMDEREYILSRQLLRSGTSIGANVEEANQGESKADFIHKLSIANKEAVETNYWLRLLRDSDTLDKSVAESLLTSCREVERLLTSILKTSKARFNQR
jgi:four helix bundle protein